VAFFVCALAALVVVAGAARVSPALAATGHVTNCGASGAGSLPAVVSAATSGDTIVFDQDCTGATKIALSTEISVSGKTLTIDGTGHTVTIDGGGSFGVRAFNVDAASTLTLVHLTLANGFTTGAGGAITSAGTLTVDSSTFTGNYGNFTGGGGIYSTGSLTVHRSTFDNNTAADLGAAIRIGGGTGTIETSEFTGNHMVGAEVSGGAAIENEGVLTVDRSLFTGNGTFFANGGAIRNTGTLTLRNSTVYLNYSNNGGALYNSGGTSTLQNDTFSGSEGGALNNGSERSPSPTRS
jgi:hypothetical protein